jgi:hypothetical protein
VLNRYHVDLNMSAVSTPLRNMTTATLPYYTGPFLPFCTIPQTRLFVDNIANTWTVNKPRRYLAKTQSREDVIAKPTQHKSFFFFRLAVPSVTIPHLPNTQENDSIKPSHRKGKPPKKHLEADCPRAHDQEKTGTHTPTAPRALPNSEIVQHN